MAWRQHLQSLRERVAHAFTDAGLRGVSEPLLLDDLYDAPSPLTVAAPTGLGTSATPQRRHSSDQDHDATGQLDGRVPSLAAQLLALSACAHEAVELLTSLLVLPLAERDGEMLADTTPLATSVGSQLRGVIASCVDSGEVSAELSSALEVNATLSELLAKLQAGEVLASENGPPAASEAPLIDLEL